MKKINFLFVILFCGVSFAQTLEYTAIELTTMNGVSFNTVSNLVDTYMKDAKFNENSGYVLQRVWQGSESNIRLLWYSPLGMSNRSDGGMTAAENTAFWRSMNDYADGNRAYSGRVLSWKQGAENQNNMHNFSVIVSDPVNFKAAHDKDCS